MNSCLYECRVMHHRMSPKEHRFSYRIFMFCLDLAEIDPLQSRLRLFSRNRWNLYSFFDRDHLTFSSADVLGNLRDYLRRMGSSVPLERAVLVTLPRVLGYIFNPVSFFFCFGIDGQPFAAVAQVGNTFGEMKLFHLPDCSEGKRFILKQTKYFYVSPFFEHDLEFEFDLRVPGGKLVMQIDDYRGTEKVLHTTLSGERVEITDGSLARMTLKYPLVTLKVIGGIHWEALRLWWKGLPAQRKIDHPQLQRDIHRS